MRPDNEDDELNIKDEGIVIPPRCGWQSLDGQLNVQNKSDKTIMVVIYYEAPDPYFEYGES